MADAEMVKQGFLRGDDVADRDVRKIGALGPIRIDEAARRRCGNPACAGQPQDDRAQQPRVAPPIAPDRVRRRMWFARTLSLCGFSSLPRQGAYANTRRLNHQEIAGKLASVDANDRRYQLGFRRTRQAIEFQQDYATNLQPLANAPLV